MNGLKNWVRIKNEILGETYDLSLAFLGDEESRAVNRRWRGQDEPANVLSFPLGPESGEILLNPKQAERDRFSLLELLIHGLLHLKGLNHGSRMKREERRLIKYFTLNGSSSRRRT